jgi:hypothetical protein
VKLALVKMQRTASVSRYACFIDAPHWRCRAALVTVEYYVTELPTGFVPASDRQRK